MERIELSQKLRKQPGHVKDDVVDKLVYGSGGMFRWTALQMQGLKSRRILRSKEITSILSSLPSDLDSTYERILDKIDPTIVDEAAAALRWLVSANRPLFVEELAEACIIRVEDPCPFDMENRLSPLDILDLLPGLIKVEPTPDPTTEPRLQFHTVSLAHFSVKEYLIGQRIISGPLEIFGVDSRLAHSCTVRSCLAYISCCKDVVSSPKLDDPADALRPYAFSEWTYHASMTPQDLLRDVSVQALEVFQKPEKCLTLNAVTNLVQRTKCGGFRSQFAIPFKSYTTKDWPQYYTLLYAIRLQNITMAKLFLEQGLDLGSAARTDDFLALALNSHRLDITELLLDNGYEPGRSELLLGMTHATPRILSLILNHAPPLSLHDFPRALYLAVESSQDKHADMLFEHAMPKGSKKYCEQFGSDRQPTGWLKNLFESSSNFDPPALTRFLLRRILAEMHKRIDARNMFLETSIQFKNRKQHQAYKLGLDTNHSPLYRR